jgi:hypothetical protein
MKSIEITEEDIKMLRSIYSSYFFIGYGGMDRFVNLMALARFIQRIDPEGDRLV